MKATADSEAPLVAVISHLWIGHIPSYHRLIVERANKIGLRVVSITPDGVTCAGAAKSYRYGRGESVTDVVEPNTVDKADWTNRLHTLVKSIRLPLRTGILTALRARRNWRMLAKTLEKVGRDENRPVDFAFLAYLGYHFLEPGVSPGLVERTMPCPWGGIWNGPAPGRTGQSPLMAWLLACEAPLRARNCRTVWVPHGRLVDRLSSLALAAKVVSMPEVADLQSPAASCAAVQHIRSAAAGRRITGLLGSISLRKGILTLVDAARVAAHNAPDLFFIAAGEFSRETCGDEYEEIAVAAATAPANFLFLPGRIPDGPEFNAHVAALDIMFAVYRDFPFQSNLLTKAAHFRKAVLVAAGGVMENCTREFDLGVVVPSNDSQSVLSGIRAVLNGCRFDGQPLHPRFEEYAAMNDASLLDQLLAAAVKGEGSESQAPKGRKSC